MTTSLTFVLLVNQGPQGGQAALSALRFARTAVTAGHRVRQVFFYHEGVHTGQGHAEPPTDEPDIRDAWRSLAKEHGIDLALCVAAGLRRGLKAETVAAGFRISGLGVFMETLGEADRTVTFAA